MYPRVPDVLGFTTPTTEGKYTKGKEERETRSSDGKRDEESDGVSQVRGSET